MPLGALIVAPAGFTGSQRFLLDYVEEEVLARQPPLLRRFLLQVAALPRLKVIVTLGDVARRNVLKAIGLKASAGIPGHGCGDTNGAGCAGFCL